MPRAVYPSMAEDSRMGALLESDWPARPMPSMAKDSRMGALRLHSICRGRLPTDSKSPRPCRHSRVGGNLDAPSTNHPANRTSDLAGARVSP